MGDVGKRTAMHEYRRMFQRLHKIGLQCILHDDGSGTIHLQIPDRHRLTIVSVGNDAAADALLEIMQIAGQA